MDVYRSIEVLGPVLDAARRQGRSIGMVGTSGAMHAGHQSLIRRAAAENEVNVLYWGGTKADFAWKTASLSQQRDEDHDFRLAREAGAQILFAPPGQDMYPRRPITRVTLPEMSSEVPQLEDPSHLDTIALAMCKLWHWIGPRRAYFGEKDWQQLTMFKRLAGDLFFPVEVIGCPTVREADGLALSSRNSQLGPEHRKAAPVIHRALSAAREAAERGSARTAAELEQVFSSVIGGAAEIRYFTAVESDTMKPLTELVGRVRLLASIQLGATRLLDNVGLELPA